MNFSQNASDKFATMRTELKGGYVNATRVVFIDWSYLEWEICMILGIFLYFRNLRTAFRDPKSQGIYTVEPPADRSGNKKATQPVRVLSVEGLRKALRLETFNKCFTFYITNRIRFSDSKVNCDYAVARIK